MTKYRAIVEFIKDDDPVIIDTDSYVHLSESIGAIIREFRHVSVRKYEKKNRAYELMGEYEI